MKNFILLGLLAISTLFFVNLALDKKPRLVFYPDKSLKAEYIPNGDIIINDGDSIPKLSVPKFKPVGIIRDSDFLNFKYSYVFDTEYSIISDDQFLVFIDWWKKLLSKNRLFHVENGFDCDNFASLFQNLLNLTTYYDGNTAQALVGKIIVYQSHSFGFVEAADSWHMLNLVRTDTNWYVVEPQNGFFAPLDEYQNEIILAYF